MIKWILRNLLRFRSDDSGTVLVLVSLALPAIFGFAALSIDLGYAYYIKAKLQNAADIGALAGGTLLYKNDESTVENKALEYVGFNIPGNWSGNTPTSIRVTTVAETKCLNTLVTQGLTCDGITKSNNGANGANALKVTLTARAPLIFASALGYRYANFTATALVSGSGSAPPPLNIAIVIDNSRSMYSETVATCGTLRNVTKMRCALFSMQGMLATLWPSIDQVALFAMPGLSASLDSSPCGGALTRRDYRGSSAAVYKAVSFSSDYRLAGTPPPTGLNSASNLVKAIGYQPSTPGATSTVAPCLETRLASASGVGSYFASSIQAAQTALVAANTALVAAGQSPRQNVMMILTDGDANATQIDAANANNQCAQGVANAAAAKAAVPGTWVYAVAYKADDSKTNGRPNGNSCSTDNSTSTTITVTTTTTVATRRYSCDNRGRNCAARNVGTLTVDTQVTTQAPPAPSNSSRTTNSVNPTPTCSGNNCATSTWTATTVAVSSSTNTSTSYAMTACDSIKNMASDTAKFFSTGESVNGSTCTSPVNQGVTDLSAIFKNVALSLMKKRRIPKNIN
jgi:Flp pilus assembly protein TadG